MIANPNCSTAILCMILYPLLKLEKIIRVDVCTYQAVSGAGKLAIDELLDQIHSYSNNLKLEQKIFKSQILLNCFSHNSSIDLDNGYNEEEIKIINETKKILDTDIEVSASCMRVPVLRSHTESVKIVFEKPVDETLLRTALENFSGVKIHDFRKENSFPEPLMVEKTGDILVGRIRKDYHIKDGTVYHLNICGDQLLKGAALNAFQIFEIYLNLL